MKVNIIRKGVAAILAFLMMWSVAFGATISNLKFKKDTVSFDYYVSGDNATVWAYDTANPSNVLYIDQEEADGSFSFGLPDGFEGEQVTVRVGGSNEPVAQETVYVTPTPAPTPDPESVEAGGIYAYVNKEDFTTMSINYDEKYIVTDADFKEEANANAYAAGAEGIIVYEEYSGAEGVFYVDGHSLGSPYFKYSFDPIKSGKAKFTVRFMHSTYPQAGSDGEVFFFSILDGTNSEFAIRNCTAQYTSNTVPVSGMYFWNGNDDYTRFRSAGADATWQTLTYLVDMDKKSFEVEYNGESVGTGSFYSSNVTELSQIYFTGGRKQWQGNYYLDEIKVLAETADEYETHTVTFHGEDGGVLETKEIKAGRRMIPVDAPSKRDHTFIEWTLRDGSPADFTSITSDMDVYAKYLPRCTVEFYNQEGTEKLATTTVDYGTEAKIVAPKIDGYTFMGWRTTDGVAVDLKSITASYTLYAWYEKQPTVYYYDLDAFGNASLYRTQTIDYATDAEIIVAPTSRQDKKFIAWGTADGVVADLSNVRGDRKVYAIYGTQDSTAMEDFENIIDRVNAAMGSKVMTSDYLAGGTYENMQGTTGYANITMFAHSDPRANNLQRGWRTDTVDGSKVWRHTGAIAFNHDDMKLYPQKTTNTDFYHLGYDFKMDQWNNAQSADASAGGFGSVFGKLSGATNSTELIKMTASTRENRGLAVYNPVTKAWVSIIPYNASNPDLMWHHVDYYIDVTNLKAVILLDGVAKASIPLSTSAVSSIDYVRFGLLHGGHVGTQSYFNLDNIEMQSYTNSDVVVAPTYYTVTFYAEDGVTVLGTARVAEGKTAVFEGETPGKEPTDKLEYKFAGWSKDISSVIEDMSVTPIFTPSARKYNVTFMIDGKPTVVPTEYGTGAKAPENPSKPADAQYTYTFSKWDKDFSNITSDLTVTAVFDSTLREYTVTFYKEDKTSVIKSESVAYGKAATAPQAPAKEGDDKVTYTFKGWVDAAGKVVDLTSIKGETKVYASYEAHYAVKEIKVIWGDVNGDGVVNLSDATAIITGLSSDKKTYGDYTIKKAFANELLWGDINGDGVVNLSDATAIITGLSSDKKAYGDYTIKKEETFEIPVQ